MTFVGLEADFDKPQQILNEILASLAKRAARFWPLPYPHGRVST